MNEHFRDEFGVLFDTFLRSTSEGRQLLRGKEDSGREEYESMLDLFWDHMQDLIPQETRLAFERIVKSWSFDTIAPPAKVRAKVSTERHVREWKEERAALIAEMERRNAAGGDWELRENFGSVYLVSRQAEIESEQKAKERAQANCSHWIHPKRRDESNHLWCEGCGLDLGEQSPPSCLHRFRFVERNGEMYCTACNVFVGYRD